SVTSHPLSWRLPLFSVIIRRPPRPTLFLYTTLFRFLAFVSVAAYELAPGRWVLRVCEAFSWFPLVGRGHLLGAIDFALYFCWFAFVLVLSLRWRRARASAAIALGGAAVFAMLARELAQRSMPGRTADTRSA